jgi:hypothetical protein
MCVPSALFNHPAPCDEKWGEPTSNHSETSRKTSVPMLDIRPFGRVCKYFAHTNVRFTRRDSKLSTLCYILNPPFRVNLNRKGLYVRRH